MEMVDILEYEERATGRHMGEECDRDRTGGSGKRYLEWIKRV